MCIACATKWYGTELEETPKKQATKPKADTNRKFKVVLNVVYTTAMGSLTAVQRFHFLHTSLRSFCSRLKRMDCCVWTESESVSSSIKANVCFILFYCF